MKQRQLADVFIKVLGLYFLVDGTVRTVSGVLNLLATFTSRGAYASLYLWVSPFAGALMAIIGFLLVMLSRAIADLLFKDE